MADTISKKNIAENSKEVSLKTPDFWSPSNHQEQLSNEFDGNTVSACFSNILEKFTIKPAYIMGSFAEVFKNNQAKNINKINDEILKKLENFNKSLTKNNKAKSSTGIPTTSINTQTKQKLWGWLQLALTPETLLGPMLMQRMMEVVVFRRKPMT